MRELTKQDEERVAELAFDSAKAVSVALHAVAEQFLPRVREVHLLGCESATHTEDSVMRDAEICVLVATGVVFHTLMQGLEPAVAVKVAASVSAVLGSSGALTVQRTRPPEPKAKA